MQKRLLLTLALLVLGGTCSAHAEGAAIKHEVCVRSCALNCKDEGTKTAIEQCMSDCEQDHC